MKALPELLGHYNAIDQHLESQRLTDKDKMERRQIVNDQAYFVLCWGQLEKLLDQSCRDAIRKRCDNPDWGKRRGWDIFNPEDKRLSGLSFEERVSLVLDKKPKAGSAWSVVMKWYQLRNLVAHGGTHDQRINLNDVIGEFYQIESQIVT